MCCLRVKLHIVLMRIGTHSSSSSSGDWTFHVFCRHKIVLLWSTMLDHPPAPTSIGTVSICCNWNGHIATSVSEHIFFFPLSLHVFTLFTCIHFIHFIYVISAHPVSEHRRSRVVSHFLNWINSCFILIRQIKEKYMQMKSRTRPQWWNNWDICRIAHIEQRYNSQSLSVAVMDVEAHL